MGASKGTPNWWRTARRLFLYKSPPILKRGVRGRKLAASFCRIFQPLLIRGCYESSYGNGAYRLPLDPIQPYIGRYSMDDVDLQVSSF